MTDQPHADEDRWHVVVITDAKTLRRGLAALSRRAPGPDGTPFSGPWGALTLDEAESLAAAWNADPREGGTAHVAELYRYDNDPAWPDEYA